MKRLLERFCFQPGSLSPELLAKLMAPEWLRIDPQWFSASFQRKRLRYKGEELRERTRKADFVDSLTIQEDEETMFHVISMSSWDLQQAYWKLPETLGHSFDALSWLTTIPGFNAGYVFDPEDEFWQSASMINTYDVFKKPHDHLAKKKDPETGEVKIDISGNPGRSSLIPGMWLQAAWRMFFGPGAFRFLPKEKVLAFQDARRIEQLPSGTVFIELFENAFSADLPENRALQKAFREWVGLDELEAQASILPRRPNDPTVEIETGSFPHGGVKRVTQWLDLGGYPAVHSRAVRGITAEFDEDGQEIWREDIDIKR